MELNSGPNTAIKRRSEEARRPKQKSHNMSQESLRLSFCVNQTFRNINQVDQRSIVLYLARKELSATAIHHDLVTTLGLEAVSYSSVTGYLRAAIFVWSNSHVNIPETEPQFDNFDQAVLLALAERPFASIQELGRLTHLP
jgi:hypothetical protein